MAKLNAMHVAGSMEHRAKTEPLDFAEKLEAMCATSAASLVNITMIGIVPMIEKGDSRCVS